MMRGAIVGLVLCSAVGAPCAAADGPTVGAVQAAYESAKADAQGRHDDQLLIRQADCQQDRPGEFSCQVGFTDERSSNGRLYFDVIGLDRDRSGWKLVSGLCKR